MDRLDPQWIFKKRLYLNAHVTGLEKRSALFMALCCLSPSEIPERDVHTLSQRFSLSLQGDQVATSLSAVRNLSMHITGHRIAQKYSVIFPSHPNERNIMLCCQTDFLKEGSQRTH